MSQSCRTLFATICCILLSQLLVLTEANSSRLRNTKTCLSLNVAHGPEREYSTVNVTVSLIQANTGERSFCYTPGTDYFINMKTNGTSIKGLLMVQDEDKVYGQFANPSDFNQPANLRYGFCRSHGMRSITHSCDRKCNLNTSLNFPYTSPRNKNHVLEFRYSVVFSYNMYHQNVKVLFPPCSEPTPVPPSKPLICNATEFKVDKNTKRASRNCPNNLKFIVKSVTIKEDDIEYNCVNTGKEIKRKVCVPSCLEKNTNEPLCCRVRAIRKVPRSWNCTATSEGVPEEKMEINRNFRVEQHGRCECFRCSEVCPAERPPCDGDNNSVECEGDDSAGMNDVLNS